MTNISVSAPGGFAPEQAIAFSGSGGGAVPVDGSNPLPMAEVVGAATSAALSGTATSTGIAGPFLPQLGRTIWLTLSGSWAGTVAVQRSVDGGATKLPLTIGGAAWASFSGNANEPIGEETVSGASYYLAITLSSGAAGYRVTQ